MISDTLQEEKEQISELLADMVRTIESLVFLNITDYSVSKELKEKWNLRLEKFLSDIEHYKENEYPVVVLGRWNSGKSTLINAILGDDILPSANREMTSILTKVSYSNEPRVRAQFYNGVCQEISLAEIEKHIDCRGSEYSKELKQIEIGLDNHILESGICIMDTPGLGSANELNNAIAFDIIPKADSILLTFSGSDVGGKENFDLLERVLRINYSNLQNIILIITKCDALNEKDLLEAMDSLKEQIRIAQQKIGVILEDNIQICMVSSYMELKYKQFMEDKIGEKQLFNDKKLRVSSAGEIQALHQESGFDGFYKVLNKSILNSGNKKNITNRLFLMSHNLLGQLMKDYESVYRNTFLINNKSLNEMKDLLQRKVHIEKKVCSDARKEVKKFDQLLIKLNCRNQYNNEKSREVISNIYKELCVFIDNTSYTAIRKNNFELLNNELMVVSVRLVTDWLKEIKKDFDEVLKNTVTKIEEIIEKNDEEIDRLFENDLDKGIDLNIDSIHVRADSIFSNIIISAASGAPIGAGLFAVGNALMPGIGGIVGGIAGGVLGLTASMITLTGSQRRHQALKNNLNNYLFERMDAPQRVLNDLGLKYREIVKLLNQYLDVFLEQTIKEKEIFTENYDETKKRYEQYIEKVKADRNAIGNMMVKISREFPNMSENL